MKILQKINIINAATWEIQLNKCVWKEKSVGLVGVGTGK